MKLLLTVIFLTVFLAAPAQYIQVDTSKPLPQIEEKLVALADTMFARGMNINFNDSIDPEGIFYANLSLVLSLPRSFNYPFSHLARQYGDHPIKNIDIVYSDDSLLRIFNWLSPTTGTLHHFNALFQAKNKNRKIIFWDREIPHEDGDIPCTQYVDIHRLKSEPKQLYVCLGDGQASGKLPFEVIEAYEITDSVKKATILPESDSLTAQIFIDRQSTMYEKNTQTIPYSYFDKHKQVLTVPEIAGNYETEGSIFWTKKMIRLKFNGKRFVKL